MVQPKYTALSGRIDCLTFLLIGLVISPLLQAAPPTTQPTYAIVIHGGAESIPSDMKPDEVKRRLEGLSTALKTGRDILAGGGTSLDAVEQSVRVLEDDDRFNAGKGAVFNIAGRHELDAAIMDGRTLNAGAVGGVTTIRNPIVFARLVMQKSGTVLLCGSGAEEFADGFPEIQRVPNTWFDTPWRYDALQKKLKSMKAVPSTRPATDPSGGTVGCVAIDSQGNLAAATSTGGLTGKRVGRVGDTPLIGCGTYANQFAAVSGTGIGEEFIRHTIAREVAEVIENQHLTAEQAAELVVTRELKPRTGGVIVVDRSGNCGMFFNTTGMYRGSADSSGAFHVAMYADK
jgi:beta-aspartyl-peptidase (threonine type)